MTDYREEARLDALQQLKLLEQPASESFDRITRMASQIFGLPVAAVSLTDRDRQWFLSRVGVEHQSIPRHQAPCSAVAETTDILVLEDLLADPCYADSLLARNGTRFYAGAPLVTSDGYGLGALCVLGPDPRCPTAAELGALTDLAAMVMAQIELRHAFSHINAVSGLPTRIQFRDDVIDLARDHGGEHRFAILIDLARDDQISSMARALGEARIDDMVREAAAAIQTALGPSRSVYHVSTTQFAFLSPPDVEQSSYLDQVRTGFDRVRASSTVRFVTSVAIGVRPFILGQVSADNVLRGAASAAQDARIADGAISLYSATLDDEHRRRYRLLLDFGAALESADQLSLVFQPRVDLATHRCVGVEALLRWRHPQLGDVSPSEFIPIIEQTALARATTQWVLDAALDQLARWSADGTDLVMSVNISAANLSDHDLIERIQLGLLKRRLRPDQLEIELTESAIMERPDQALAMLSDLAMTGISLAIDDFGTGQSSLAYLQRLPADVVKIDQAFVRNLRASNGPDFVLVETMIGLAHKLGYRLVAEGVETIEAATVLAQAGCEEAQGYLFARPMSAAALNRWLAEQRDSAVPLAKLA